MVVPATVEPELQPAGWHLSSWQHGPFVCLPNLHSILPLEETMSNTAAPFTDPLKPRIIVPVQLGIGLVPSLQGTLAEAANYPNNLKD